MEITEEDIKNVFRECGYHVTPTNMTSRVAEFDPVTGDLVKDKYAKNSEWIRLKSGSVDFNNEEFQKHNQSSVIEVGFIHFDDLEHLRKMLSNDVSKSSEVLFGDAFSYLTHYKFELSNHYGLYGSYIRSDYFYGSFFWRNDDKNNRDMEIFQKCYEDKSGGYRLLDTRYTGCSASN